MLLRTKLHGKTYVFPETAGLKPPSQNMEALRADERVRFNGLPRTEAGIYPAVTPLMDGRVVPLSVKTLIFYH